MATTGWAALNNPLYVSNLECEVLGENMFTGNPYRISMYTNISLQFFGP